MKRQTKTSTTNKTTKWTIPKLLHDDITLRTVDRAADYSGVIIKYFSSTYISIIYKVRKCVCICVHINFRVEGFLIVCIDQNLYFELSSAFLEFCEIG